MGEHQQGLTVWMGYEEVVPQQGDLRLHMAVLSFTPVLPVLLECCSLLPQCLCT